MGRLFRLPAMNRLLPVVIGLMCTGLFLTCGLILISPSFDPKSPQSADAGAISPHGFQGLYKLLDARGWRSDINRRETGPQRPYDLEIITLEDVSNVYAPHADSTFDQDEHIENTSDTTASAEMTSEEVFSMDALSAEEEARAEAVQARRKAAETQPSFSGEDDVNAALQGADKAKSDHILYDAQGRVVLIVLPKWQAQPHRTRARWSQGEWPESYYVLLDLMRLISDTEAVTKTLNGGEKILTTRPRVPVDYRFARAPTLVSREVTLQPAPGQSLFTQPIRVGAIKGLQSVQTGDKLTPLLVGPGGEVILARVNALPGERPLRQPVYLLSDPDVLNNQILSDPQKVIGALDIIDRMRGDNPSSPSVVFNLTYNGHSVDKSLLFHIATPPFIGVPLSFMILGLGLMWAAFFRFGPAQDRVQSAPLGRGVTILADNVARLVGKVGREPKLAPLYAQMVRDAALKACNAQGHVSLSSDQLADQLSARAGTRELYTAIASDAAKVARPADLLRLCQRLYQWRQETGAPKTHMTTSTTET